MVGLGMVLAAGVAAFANDDTQVTPKPVSPSATTTSSKSTVAQPTTAPASQKRLTPPLSAWSAQVLKLAQARIDEDVVFSYIDSAGTFNLTTDQIIGLTEAGVPKNVVAAMLQHDADILAGVRQVMASTVPSSEIDSLIPPLPQAAQATAENRNSSTAAPLSVDDFSPSSGFMPDIVLEPLDEFYSPPEMLERSPVRKPYPVPLTAPILVWRLP